MYNPFMGIPFDAPKPTRLILLRHGQSEANKQGKMVGVTDSPLTEEGRHQGKSARPLIARFGIDNVLSSPLSRARETTRLATGRLPKVVAQLIERNFGIAEDQPVTPELISYLTGPYKERYNFPYVEGGESDRDIMNRLDQFFDQHGPELRGKTSVLGGHASTWETLWSDFQVVRGARPKRFGNGSFYVVEASGNSRTPDLKLIHTSGIIYERTAA